MPAVNTDAVISMSPADSPTGTGTFTVEELVDLVKRGGIAAETLFNEGFECRTMTPTSGWQTGRLRLTFDFAPVATPPTVAR